MCDLLTTDAIPLLDAGIRVCAIQAEARTWTRPELHQLHFNRKLSPAASALARPGRIIYQRYGAFNWTGAALSRQAGLPFVLEFNGPEAWLAEHWGVGLLYPELAARIEQANLEAADLVSVVSEPLRQHVLARGIPEQRIIVLPNGVDPERFRPDLDGAPMRESLGLGDRCAIGFIGTFGPWHGVETLAEAFIRLLQRRPDLSGKISLVLIGDGLRLPGVKDMLRGAGVLGDVVLTGLVPQAEGPAYLAACDILVLPTAPNPDGSSFFGSPTKLFEYMAMGRPIVATSLGQATRGARRWPKRSACAALRSRGHVPGARTIHRRSGLAAEIRRGGAPRGPAAAYLATACGAAARPHQGIAAARVSM